MKLNISTLGFFLSLLLLAGCTTASNPSNDAVNAELGQSVSRPNIDHLHGIALSPDGNVVTLATHDGLFHWSEGTWYESMGPKHDHMGFSTSIEDSSGQPGTYYTSGHPAPGSGLKNPLGLMKSTDFGKTWKILSLEGEADFHLMASSTGTLAIYSWTLAPNSQMPQRGLYFTTDGVQWERSEMNGLPADPLDIIVHPEKGGTVLAGTVLGIFISEDYGHNFTQLTDTFVISGDIVQGTNLLIGATLNEQSQTGLISLDLKTGERKELTLPPLAPREMPAYLAISPADPNTIFLATPQKNVFISRDSGISWEQILKQ